MPAIAEVLGAAFEHDPMVRWPMPEGTVADYTRMFATIITPYVDADALWCVDDVTGVTANGIAGAAAWLGPTAVTKVPEWEESIRADIDTWMPQASAEYARFWDWLGGFIPEGPCWFLDILGVDPRAQGRGIGSALIRVGLERAAADDALAFLDTGKPENVAYYESHGFHVHDAQSAPGGGPTVWFMHARPSVMTA